MMSFKFTSVAVLILWSMNASGNENVTLNSLNQGTINDGIGNELTYTTLIADYEYVTEEATLSYNETNGLTTTIQRPDSNQEIAPGLHKVSRARLPLTPSKRLVCYHTNWAQYRTLPASFLPGNIDPFLCTHVIYSFAEIETNYTLSGTEWNDEPTQFSIGNFRMFTNLKLINPKLKCLLSVGGSSASWALFNEVVSSPETRALFAQNSIRFLRERNFDGLDISWLDPGVENKQRFTLLLQELAESFDAEPIASGQSCLILSISGSGIENTILTSYDIPAIVRSVDFINLITYHFHSGDWEDRTGLHSPLYAATDDTSNDARLVADYVVNLWITMGCPADKINLAIPSYGTTFSLVSSDINGVGAPADGPAKQTAIYTSSVDFYSYYEICQFVARDDVITVFDTERKVPYSYSTEDGTWIGYENELSAIYKADYVLKHGLGGAAIWSLDLDDFTGDFCGKTWPILKSIGDVLNGTIRLNVTDDNSTTSVMTATNFPTEDMSAAPSSPSDAFFNQVIIAIVVGVIVAVIIISVTGKMILHWRRSRVTTPGATGKVQLSMYSKRVGKAALDPREYPRNRVVLKEQIGSGAFGTVFRAETVGLMNGGNTTVAVKKLKESASDAAKEDFQRELCVYKMMDPHPYVITLIGYCTLEEPLYIIMEYAANGNVKSYLDKLRMEKIDDEIPASSVSSDVMKFAYQIASGMEYISSKDCVHRDLAARNILLGDGMICKLSDFGLARDTSEQQEYVMKSMGRLPIRWMSPESLLHNIFSSQSDVWSYGVLLWEIITLGSLPYPGQSSKSIIEEIKQHHILPRPSQCSAPMYTLMEMCWNMDPKKRPTFTTIVKCLAQMLEEVEGYLDMSDFTESEYSYISDDQSEGQISPELNSKGTSYTSILDNGYSSIVTDNIHQHILLRVPSIDITLATIEEDDEEEERYVPPPMHFNKDRKLSV